MRTILPVLLTCLVASIASTSAFMSSISNGVRISTTSRNMVADDNPTGISRRSWIATMGSAALWIDGLSQASAAGSGEFTTFEDPDCQFKISVPSNWVKNEETLPDRRKIILFVDPTSDKDQTLLFLAYTPVRDDFTQLSSFGSVDQVAQMTILPKGKIAGEENDSAMISAESKKNSYFFDYVAKAGGQPQTHFRTIFSLAQGATGGAGSVLVTLTAQTPESRYSEMKGVFDEMMESYGKIKS